MALQEYNEEDLQGKKYNELFKISKTLGIKTSKRLKTDKLIEAILKCQREENSLPTTQDADISQDEALSTTQDEALSTTQDADISQDEALSTTQDEALSISQDAAAVVSALDGSVPATQPPLLPSPQDEVLMDVQFPGSSSQDSLNVTFEAEDDTCLPEDTNTAKEDKTDVSVSPQDLKTHKRSGTYDKEEKEEEEEKEESNKKKRRQRSSTFDLTTSTDATLPIDEKETGNNSVHLSQLMDQVTVRGGRRNATKTTKGPGEGQKCTRTKNTTEDGPAASKRPLSRNSQVPSPWRSKESDKAQPKRQRRSVTITPSAAAPPLRPSLQLRRQSRGTPVAHTTAAATTTVAAPKTTTTTAAVSASKPKFTIGRGDKKTEETKGTQGKGASGIPRFMSYVRRLKMPNFARIHNEAFQRMEGLDDYVDKRKVRQDTLGSTTKKTQDKTEVFQPSVTSVRSIDFNFTDESPAKTSQAANQSESRDTLPEIPTPKTLKKTTSTPGNARLSKRVSREVTAMPDKIPITSSTKKDTARKSPRLSRKPSMKSTKKTSPKPSLKEPEKKINQITKKTTPKTTGQRSPLKPGNDGAAGHKAKTGQKVKISPRSSKKVSSVTFPAFGFHLKENFKPGKRSISSPLPSKLPLPSDGKSPASVRKRMQDYSQGLASRGTSYAPYKGAVKPLKSRDALKTLAERKHNIKSSKEIREGQKNILKGVRLNKRFELQMAKRGLTL